MVTNPSPKERLRQVAARVPDEDLDAFEALMEAALPREFRKGAGAAMTITVRIGDVCYQVSPRVAAIIGRVLEIADELDRMGAGEVSVRHDEKRVHPAWVKYQPRGGEK